MNTLLKWLLLVGSIGYIPTRTEAFCNSPVDLLYAGPSRSCCRLTHFCGERYIMSSSSSLGGKYHRSPWDISNNHRNALRVSDTATSDDAVDMSSLKEDLEAGYSSWNKVLQQKEQKQQQQTTEATQSRDRKLQRDGIQTAHSWSWDYGRYDGLEQSSESNGMYIPYATMTNAAATDLAVPSMDTSSDCGSYTGKMGREGSMSKARRRRKGKIHGGGENQMYFGKITSHSHSYSDSSCLLSSSKITNTQLWMMPKNSMQESEHDSQRRHPHHNQDMASGHDRTFVNDANDPLYDMYEGGITPPKPEASSSVLYSKKSIPASSAPQPRIGGKRRRALRAVSSFISSLPPLHMIHSSRSQQSQDGEKDVKQKEEDGGVVSTRQQLSLLQQENNILRQQISHLYQENQRLHQSHHRQRIILEQFEGEGKPMLDVNGDVVDSIWWEKEEEDKGGEEEEQSSGLSFRPRRGKSIDQQWQKQQPLQYRNGTEYQVDGPGKSIGGMSDHAHLGTSTGGVLGTRSQGATGSTNAVAASSTVTPYPRSRPLKQERQVQNQQQECRPQDYDDGTCPIEPDISFKDALKDRAYWLVGLLTLQSMSGFILARNEELLQTHPVIVYFLTMLVGAGGNAGNQAAVRVIRGIALGTLNERTQRQFLQREVKMATSLSVILSMAGFIRAIAFGTPLPETFAVTSALAIIVFTSICFGAVLPLILRKVDVDPAHSSTTIQVIMDILGVVLTVVVSTTILDSPFGQVIISKLTGAGASNK